MSLTTDALSGDPQKFDDPELLAALIRERELVAKKQAWVSWTEREHARCKNARLGNERQWFLNLAFVSGKQYVSPIDVPGHGFRLTVPKAPPWRVRLTINKIRTAVRTECSKLTSSKPIPTVVPATNESEDFSAAAVGEQLLKAAFSNAEFERTYRSWVWWGVVCGTSFMKMWWDPQGKDYENMTLPQLPLFNGEPMPPEILDEARTSIPGFKDAMDRPVPAVGKICRERITPFHIFVPDLLCETLEGQPYLIHVMTKSPLWVKNTYGVDANPDAHASTTVLDAASIIQKGAEDNYDGVLVREVWIKPGGHPDFPQGGMFTVINSKVVDYREEWPCPFPEFPFYKYDGTPTGGFYAESNVTDLIPLQKEYNKTRSQAIEIKNTMGKPKLMYQKGSLNPRKISSEPGQMVEYTAGYEPPVPLPASEIPQSYINEITILSGEFDDISGQHEISRGDVPNGALSSGTAIAYLQEQDDAKLNYQVASIELSVETLGRHHLAFVSKYWQSDRIVKVAGKNQAYEAFYWKQNSLKGNHDVRVQTGSALPFSKAARQAMITEMMANGWLAPEDGMEVLNFGGFENVLDEVKVDKRQAQRENLKMSTIPVDIAQTFLTPQPGPNDEAPIQLPNPTTQGPENNPVFLNGDGTPFTPKPPVPVNSWDNHEEHIHWHNQFRKTQEFELLDPVLKQGFELHIQLHQAAMSMAMVNERGVTVQPAADGSDPNAPEPPAGPGEFKEEGNQGNGAPNDSPQQSPSGPPTAAS